MLISVEQLYKELSSDSKPLVFDCRFSLPGPQFDPEYGRNVYQEGHITGAIYVDLEQDLSSMPGPDTGRHPLPEESVFLEKLQQWGVCPDRDVVVYDDCGALIAGRFWWMLRYWVGHRNVRVLNGGFPAWQAVGCPVTEEATETESVDHRYQTSMQYIKTPDDVRRLVSNEQKGCLIDARGATRFTGEEEPVDPVAGHIPGAVNYFCMDNLLDGRFKSPEVLRSRFASVIESYEPDQIVHYCGSGVTACHNILALEIAGISDTRLYAGSWSEWIRNPENCIATGR